jgi:hypothetical protein
MTCVIPGNGKPWTVPTWSIGGQNIQMQVPGFVVNFPTLLEIQSTVVFADVIDCSQNDWLGIDKNYLGLCWLNNYGAWDTFFFSYGEGGQYGGNAPVHSYNAGKSMTARRDFDITQTNRGIQTQSWAFNSGMMPVQWVPFFQGLMASNVIWAIPPGVPIAGMDVNSFQIQNQQSFVRVYLEDADWEDSVIGEPKTRFSGTVTASNIIKGRQI